jgi:hypothetical protein
MQPAGSINPSHVARELTRPDYEIHTEWRDRDDILKSLRSQTPPILEGRPTLRSSNFKIQNFFWVAGSFFIDSLNVLQSTGYLQGNCTHAASAEAMGSAMRVT